METAVPNKEFVEVMLNNAKIAYEVVEAPILRIVVKCFEITCDIYPDVTGYESTRGLGFLVVWNDRHADFKSTKSLQEFILCEGAEMTGGLHHVKDPALGLSTQLVNALIWNKNIFAIEDTIPLFESGEIYKARSIGKKGRESLYNTLVDLGYRFTVKPINKQSEKDAMIFKSVNELAEKLGKPVEEVQSILKECDITVAKRKRKEEE